MRRLYIAGPITGQPDNNKAKFAEAETLLNGAGYATINPQNVHEDHCDDDGRPGEDAHTWRWYMARCLPLVLESDGVALLPGWRGSRGARVEHDLAWAAGIDSAPVADWLWHGEMAR